MNDEIVQALGFNDLIEFNHLVSEVNLSTQENIVKFKEWQYKDGTKIGLLKLGGHHVDH